MHQPLYPSIIPKTRLGNRKYGGHRFFVYSFLQPRPVRFHDRLVVPLSKCHDDAANEATVRVAADIRQPRNVERIVRHPVEPQTLLAARGVALERVVAVRRASVNCGSAVNAPLSNGPSCTAATQQLERMLQKPSALSRWRSARGPTRKVPRSSH